MSGRAVTELRLGTSLADDPRIVGPLVLAVEPFDGVPGFADGRRHVTVELIRECEQQHHQRVLVVGIDVQSVQADALGLAGLVQQAIPLRFRHRSGHGFRRESLELECHGDLRNTRSSFLSGS